MESVSAQSRAIISEVRQKGDSALLDFTERFDGAKLSSVRVTEEEFSRAGDRVTVPQRKALAEMKKRLERSEKAVLRRLEKGVTVSLDGVRIVRSMQPIKSVGCYVPGGKARYPSTLVMCAVPAKVAGVERIVAVSPPGKDGDIDPLTLVASEICGVNEFYKVGGAQGIAGLAFGTESIKPVDKIVGPGGVFVTAAKLAVSGAVSVDMVAGPTELLVYADDSADPKLVASDLISQAEHSGDTVCGLVCRSEQLASKVDKEIQSAVQNAPRSEIVSKSLGENGFSAICNADSDAIEFINAFAPEHLEVISKNPRSIAKGIRSAGIVLLGKSTPSSASDYCLGTNHVLPTGAFGRSRGSLSVLDFLRLVNTVEATPAGLKKVAPYVGLMANAEGLPNHYQAVRNRFEESKN